MSFRGRARKAIWATFLVAGAFAGHVEAASCVWKVTAAGGGIAYLGGSIHALRSTDYPLPAAYNRAFDASSRLALEVDEQALAATSKSLEKAGTYPKGDTLKNHVDPRTYDYVRRVFGLMNVPEAKFAKYKPWFIVLVLQSLETHGFSGSLGVEQFLLKRAKANSKPVTGLETGSEHAAVYSGLTDRQGEALLLFTFIPRARESGNDLPWMQAWRNGDADKIARMMHETYRDFPSFGERLLGARNRLWIPKIEGYLRSGQTYFVVAGAAHFGGSDGVLALLRARGYQVAQL